MKRERGREGKEEIFRERYVEKGREKHVERERKREVNKGKESGRGRCRERDGKWEGERERGVSVFDRERD